MKRLTLLVTGVALLAVMLAGFIGPAPSVSATGPCTVSGAGLDGEELQFLGRLQQWRSSPGGVAHPTPLESSGALNAAAAWFAQWQVDHGVPGGHEAFAEVAANIGVVLDDENVTADARIPHRHERHTGTDGDAP